MLFFLYFSVQTKTSQELVDCSGINEDTTMVKDEVCANIIPEDPQSSMFVDVAAASNGELVYAVGEDGNKIAVGVIMKEDFGYENNNLECNESKKIDDFEDCTWIAGEEECMTIDVGSEISEGNQTERREMSLISESNAQKSIEKDPKKDRKDVVKIYQVDHAARKTLKKMEVGKCYEEKSAQNKSKETEF